ncbi:hypothetical protein BGZ59_002946 [Podila verticillata]|nr:hypothetical protein BGZ59_002946 [Podila verticillata]
MSTRYSIRTRAHETEPEQESMRSTRAHPALDSPSVEPRRKRGRPSKKHTTIVPVISSSASTFASSTSAASSTFGVSSTSGASPSTTAATSSAPAATTLPAPAEPMTTSASHGEEAVPGPEPILVEAQIGTDVNDEVEDDGDEQPNSPSHVDKGKGRALPQPESLSPPLTARSTIRSSLDEGLDLSYGDSMDQWDDVVSDLDGSNSGAEELFPTPQGRRRMAVPEPTVPDQITIAVNFRLGEPLTHTRPRRWLPGPTAILYRLAEDDYSELCHRIQRKARLIKENVEWLEGSNPYLQPNNTATAAQYLALDSSNCNGLLRAAWIKESHRLRRKDVICNVYVQFIRWIIFNHSWIIGRANLNCQSTAS